MSRLDEVIYPRWMLDYRLSHLFVWGLEASRTRFGTRLWSHKLGCFLYRDGGFWRFRLLGQKFNSLTDSLIDKLNLGGREVRLHLKILCIHNRSELS